MKGGGIPYRSVLNPHYDLIVARRRKGATWQQISSELQTLGVPITYKGVHAFAKRRSKAKRRSILLPPDDPQSVPPPAPATGSERPRSGLIQPYLAPAPGSPRSDRPAVYNPSSDLPR